MHEPVYILGISAFWPDSAACLLRDGRVVAAAHEAVFSRQRDERHFPENAAAFCLHQEGITPADVATVAIGSSPWRDVAALFRTSRTDTLGSGWRAIRHSGAVLAHHAVLHKALRPLGYRGRIAYTPWYTAHAAAVHASPFEEAAILVLDDTAGPATGVYGRHVGDRLEVRLLSDLGAPQAEMTLAAMARRVRDATGQNRLVLTGSVTLRAQQMASLVRERVFEDVWIPPAPTAAGTCIGAALHTWEIMTGASLPHPEGLHGGALGPGFRHEAVASYLEEERIPHTPLRDECDVLDAALDLLAAGRRIGWFQGRQEFATCAMGGRHVFAALGSPHADEAPEAPPHAFPSVAVPADAAAEHFDLPYASPSGLLVAPARGVVRDRLHALRPHAQADGPVRILTVKRDHAPLLHRLLEGVNARTGYPVLISTTLRAPGGAMACTLPDAYAALMHGPLDAVLLGPFLLDKRQQPPPEDDLAWLTRNVDQ